MLQKIYFIENLFIICLLYFFSPNFIQSSVRANDIIFQDNFESLNLSNWQIKDYAIEEGGSFSSIGQLNITPVENKVQISGYGNYEQPVLLDGKWVGNIGKALVYSNPIISNDIYDVETDIEIKSGDENYESVLFLEFDSNNRIAFNIQSTSSGKFAQLVFDENNAIRCPVDGAATVCLSKGYMFNNNEIIHLKISFDPQSKIVNSYIDNQMIAWGIYTGVINNPHVGFASTMFGLNHFIDIRFDNFKVSLPNKNSSLTVPDIKQFDSLWGSEIYDNATSWYPNNPSISRWGCAMTSASMLLNYYGYRTDPYNLNLWLKLNSGYTRNGGILWPSIFKFTKIYSDSAKPLLEFAYHNPDDEFIANEINNTRPPILKMQNINGNTHFIVARGKFGSDFEVNDPASLTSQIGLLSEAKTKWGNINKIGTFTPSHSDGSYIALYINNDFDFKISSESAEITDNKYYFTDTPFIDPDNLDSTINVESLNAFYLPKPEIGKYTVRVIGSGNYQLDSYLYSKDGDQTLFSFKGNSSLDKDNYYDIYFEDEVKFVFPVNISEGFVYVINSIQNAYDIGIIKNEDLFDSVDALIKNAYRQYQNGKYFSPKILLNLVITKLKFNTPVQIDEEFSSILQNQLKLLFNNIL